MKFSGNGVELTVADGSDVGVIVSVAKTCRRGVSVARGIAVFVIVAPLDA